MNNDQIKLLEWDSRLFGYNVAKVIITSQNLFSLDKIKEELIVNDIRLCYFFVDPTDKVANKNLVGRGATLVDQKAVFSKKVKPSNDLFENIKAFDVVDLDADLLSLAYIAGENSRFKTDANFKNKEFEKLYHEWIRKSANGEISFCTLVYFNESNKKIGFLTLQEKDGVIEIGLIATLKEAQGKGVGTSLIKTAENIAYQKKCKIIKVTTQLHNKKACDFYKKNGFLLDSVTNIYHLWLHTNS